MKIILNTELVRATEDKGEITVFIRMGNGQWARQRPYAADLRGQIGALTLAIDALAGKIILQDSVLLDERDFNTNTNKQPAGGSPPLTIEAPKTGTWTRN